MPMTTRPLVLDLNRAGKKIGICGQAPSDYPEFAQFLVEKGISSISLNPDTVLQTTHTILQAESSLRPKSGEPVKVVEVVASRESSKLVAELSKTTLD